MRRLRAPVPAALVLAGVPLLLGLTGAIEKRAESTSEVEALPSVRPNRPIGSLVPRPLVPAWPAAPADVPGPKSPRLRSAAWYVVDDATGRVLTAHDAETPRPIASITKLMAALVLADLDLPGDLPITIEKSDLYFFQVTKSSLRPGMTISAADLLQLALLNSDNRATVALARATGMMMDDFVAAMNRKAVSLGLASAHFAEPTGLSPENRASARDSALLIEIAHSHPKLGPLLGRAGWVYERLDRPRRQSAVNSNRLVRSEYWDVLASKTGFTQAAGSCHAMKMRLSDGRVVTVGMLGARGGAEARYPDAVRLRHFLEGKDRVESVRIASRRPHGNRHRGTRGR